MSQDMHRSEWGGGVVPTTMLGRESIIPKNSQLTEIWTWRYRTKLLSFLYPG